MRGRAQLALADGEGMAVGLLEAVHLERADSTLGAAAAVWIVGVASPRPRSSAAFGPVNHRFEGVMDNVLLEKNPSSIQWPYHCR